MSELKEIAALAKTVFGTDDGQKLLKKLNSLFCDRALFNPEAITQAYNLGKHDLVQEINFYTNATDKEVQDIVFAPTDDFFD